MYDFKPEYILGIVFMFPFAICTLRLTDIIHKRLRINNPYDYKRNITAKGLQEMSKFAENSLLIAFPISLILMFLVLFLFGDYDIQTINVWKIFVPVYSYAGVVYLVLFPFINWLRRSTLENIIKSYEASQSNTENC